MTAAYQIVDVEQGSQEWLELRKTKITATDMAVIMGANPWKTAAQLYHEKVSPTEQPIAPNEKMQRGTELEPIARDLFNMTYGMKMVPRVAVRGFIMASLDGMNERGQILEVKSPGEKAHAIALAGKVPDYYFPQLQCQMYVCEASEVFYYSFDGFDGVLVRVPRDEAYITKMVEKAQWFYGCIVNRTPPEKENDYIERNDEEWFKLAMEWASVSAQIKEMEKKEEDLRNNLIALSGSSNSRGAGISLCQVQRKGNVEYSKIPELKGVDLEKYRKESVSSWRITCQ